MSAEAIIAQIKKDATKEIQKIEKEAEIQVKERTEQIKNKTDEMKQDLLQKGKQDIENIKRIELAKANQDAKRAQMKAKEDIIETCFTNAFNILENLNEEAYTALVDALIIHGKKQINGPVEIKTSRPEDASIAKSHDITVTGSVSAIGGIVLRAKDGSKIIDNTFEGILKRKKQDIRVQVGSILFPVK